MTALVIYDQFIDLNTVALEAQVEAVHREAAEIEEDMTRLYEESIRLASLLNTHPDVASIAKELANTEEEIRNILSPNTEFTHSPGTPPEELAAAASRAAASEEKTSAPFSGANSYRDSRNKELKALYRSLSSLTHPDCSAGDKRTKALFPLVSRLYREGNLSALRDILESVLEYQETRKSNKKRQSLLRSNLTKARTRLAVIRRQFSQAKESVNYQLVFTYRDNGLDVAKQLHKAMLSSTLRAKQLQLQKLKAPERTRTSSFSSVFSFLATNS